MKTGEMNIPEGKERDADAKVNSAETQLVTVDMRPPDSAPEGKINIQAPISPVLNLLPYQRRWVADNSPLKIVVKGRQIGFSFAATIRAVF